MSKTHILAATVLAVSAIALFSREQFNPHKLPPVEKAIYAAMLTGHRIADAGGTEQDIQKLFVQINVGDTNALQLWFNSVATKCPPLVRKSIELGWSARDAGKSVEELVSMYENIMANTNLLKAAKERTP